MSSLFVPKGRVAVHDDDDLSPGDPAQSTVYIKARMNGGDKARYKDVLVYRRLTGDKIESGIAVGTAQLELLRINILGWIGPRFVGETGHSVPYSEEMIDQLDTDDPFMVKVLEVIDAQNPAPRTEDVRKKSMSDGESPSLENTGEIVEIATYSSPSQNGTTGRRIKSVN